MALQLLPWVNREVAYHGLEDARNSLSAADSSPMSYMTWVTNQLRMFKNWFPSEVIADLCLTPRFQVIQQVVAGSFATQTPPILRLLIQTEMDDRRQFLEDAIQDFREELASWDNSPGQIIMPDSNIFLHHKLKFDEVDWRRIHNRFAQTLPGPPMLVCIPMIVIRELDRLKQNQSHRFRAAYSLSRISELFGEASATNRSVPLGKVGSGQVAVRVVFSDPRHVEATRADDEILVQAMEVQAKSNRRVLIVTFDTGMAFGARQAGLEVAHLTDVDRPDDWKKPR